MNDKLPFFTRVESLLQERKNVSLFRQLPSPEITKKYIDFSSNSYMGMHENESVIRQADALNKLYGGNCSSRVVSQRSTLFQQLEDLICNWKDSENSLVFTSGYTANIGVLQAIGSRSGEIFCDRLNHASIYDGIALSGSKIVRYNHCDMDHLRSLLQKSKALEKFVVTDTVFSMDGDRAPLQEIVQLAEEFNAVVIVDEAHAAGVLGKRGSGLVEELGLESKIHIRIGTLSKAVASLGGFFAGQSLLKDFFVNFSRSFIYTTGLPPDSLAYSISSIQCLQQMEKERFELMEKAKYFRARLDSLSFNTGFSTTQIIPCIIGNEKKVINLQSRFKEAGIQVPAIRPPTVPSGSSRLRFSLNVNHTKENLDLAIDILRDWQRSYGE